MRKIAVIGAGQAGLLLALGLLERGYAVTMVADRNPEAILHGPIPAGAVVFDSGLLFERELKVNFWDDVAVHCEALHVDLVAPPGAIAMSFESEFERRALCVDQRLKSYRWLQEVQRRGGELLVKPATLEDLEEYARSHDLVVVAAGKGALANLFSRDDARSPFRAAQRHVAMVCLRGFQKWDNFQRPGPKFNILPGIGEIFSAPIYAKDEVQAQFLGFEAIPGGPLDRFTPGMTPAAQLALSKGLYRELLPWDCEAIRNTELVDSNAFLFGKIVPTVRDPVGTLPSGAQVVGIADTVNLHDPIAAQGANNAAKAARIFTHRIAAHGEKPFDAAWMREVFAEIWREAQHANVLNATLLAPPEPHLVEILGAAAQHPAVARRFVHSFVHPATAHPWLFDATEARRYLQSCAP